jgi:spermidine/putrescine transport system permease protein
MEDDIKISVDEAADWNQQNLHWWRRIRFIDIFSVLVIIFLFFPTLIIIVFSFNNTISTSFVFKGFTFKWYHELVRNRLFIAALKNSIYIAVATSFFSIIVGTLCTFGLTRFQFRFKGVITGFILLPMTLPGLLLGISLLSFYNFINFKLSLMTVAISHSVFCIPFVVLIVKSRLDLFDTSVEEAAKDLGANNIQTFFKVTFPLIRPTVIGAGLIAFALSFDEFLITFFTIGAKSTLPLLIWSMLRRGISPTVNAISTLVLSVSVIFIFVSTRFVGMKLNI